MRVLLVCSSGGHLTQLYGCARGGTVMSGPGSRSIIRTPRHCCAANG